MILLTLSKCRLYLCLLSELSLVTDKSSMCKTLCLPGVANLSSFYSALIIIIIYLFMWTMM